MNHVAFIFKSSPHGNSGGREGLDALLAMSSLIKDIGVFFVGDGIFQILVNQKPEMILSRNYISTFEALPFYDIQKFRVCSASLRERGQDKSTIFVLNNVIILESEDLRKDLAQYRVIFSF